MVLPPDVPKDRSTTATCVCLALDEAGRVLTERGLDMPLHLVIQADNTSRENKNSTILGLAGLLVARGRFESVTIHFHRVGHTHGPLDQRFSILGTLLQRQRTLVDPNEFMHAILTNLPQIRNREVVVKELWVLGMQDFPGAHEPPILWADAQSTWR